MKSIQRNGNDTYTYLYNLHTELTTNENDETIEQEVADKIVTLYGYPNVKDCIKAIIRECVTLELEFDLINSYNDPDRDEEDVTKYQDYLKLRNEIKTNVKADFAKYVSKR